MGGAGFRSYSARAKLATTGERGVQKLPNAPGTIGNANGLRSHGLEGLMNPAKVLVSDIQRDRCNVVG